MLLPTVKAVHHNFDCWTIHWVCMHEFQDFRTPPVSISRNLYAKTLAKTAISLTSSPQRLRFFLLVPYGHFTVSPLSKLGISDAAVARHQLTPKEVSNSSSNTLPPGKRVMFAQKISDFLGRKYIFSQFNFQEGVGWKPKSINISYTGGPIRTKKFHMAIRSLPTYPAMNFQND